MFEDVKEKVLGAAFGSQLTVIICQATSLSAGSSTTDGIEAGGARLVAEVRSCVQSMGAHGRPAAESVSFWGHSLGGLYIRWALAELADEEDGTVCGLPPRLLIFTACPHLGIAATFPPALLGAGTALGVCGRTLEQLCLTDSDGLVEKLGTEPRFVRPLRLFSCRALVANVCHDAVVDFCTAALQPWRAPWLLDVAAPDLQYPHVVHDTGSWSSSACSLSRTFHVQASSPFDGVFPGLFCCSSRRGPAPYYDGHDRAEAIHCSRKCLSALPWRIVCVRFSGRSALRAHHDICYGPDCDAVRYICDVVMRQSFSARPEPARPVGCVAPVVAQQRPSLPEHHFPPPGPLPRSGTA